MKNVTLLLVVLITTSLSAQIISQNHFRWRNDDGSEADATWRGAEDTQVTVMQNTKIRLRVEIYRDGVGSNLEAALYYHTDTDVQPAWLAREQLTTDGSTNHFILSETDYYNQNDNALNRLTDTPGYTHALGWCHETDLFKTFSVADGSDIEIEFCIQPTSNAVIDDIYYFTVRFDSDGDGEGIGYDVYDQLPSIQVIENTLPVELTAFQAGPVHGGVSLTWHTATEEDNLGFIVERRYDPDQTWQQIASYLTHNALTGQGTVTTGTDYKFSDNPDQSRDMVWYRLSNVNRDGTVEIQGTTQVNLNTALPLYTELGAAYPNPFNPVSTIPYHLAQDADVTIAIFDVLGRRIKTLVNQNQASAGDYTTSWNGTDDTGAQTAGGVYFIRMQTGNQTDTHKILLVK